MCDCTNHHVKLVWITSSSKNISSCVVKQARRVCHKSPISGREQFPKNDIPQKKPTNNEDDDGLHFLMLNSRAIPL